MTKEELRSKLDNLELAREAAERELRLTRERSERLSALERDAEDLLKAYEESCIEALEKLSPKRGERCTGYWTSPSSSTPTAGSRPPGP
jgi:hypothetical protein